MDIRNFSGVEGDSEGGYVQIDGIDAVRLSELSDVVYPREDGQPRVTPDELQYVVSLLHLAITGDPTITVEQLRAKAVEEVEFFASTIDRS